MQASELPAAQSGNGTLQRKEGMIVKLIWNELLHENFRCGRMCAHRAEQKAAGDVLPSVLRMRHSGAPL